MIFLTKIFLFISISISLIFLSLLYHTFAIPTDENSAILKSWVLPIPIYEHNKFFDLSSSFSGNNVYFVESNANKIGKLEPATNTITEWNIPTNSSLPVSIDVDSSTGNIYFAESNANKIGRLVPATNTITEWNIPTNSSLPVSISFDSSTGNIYFAESNANKIGRLVPLDNGFTEWSLQESPIIINVDSAGSIHFIDNKGSRIYRLG